MAESFSVKAILSASDSGFTSTLKSAAGAVDSLASKVGSGLSFGFLAGAGQAAFRALTNGARNLVGEINSSNKAWKTFEGNMQILGKTEGEINSVKSALQKFAETSIYSSSDMASTYAQLAAVGTKSADKLVTAFGGLAGAAENPAQAMKTLSQQATQMAAKPKVQWADFKLMLEQTPAGMASVAKEMGMTSSELVSAIQAGKVATEDFFAAVEKVGNSDGFQKLATTYKGVDEAMAGLQETLGNKLTPAFDLLSSIAIGGISGIIDKISEIDGEALADKLSAGLQKAQPYWEAFKDIAGQVGDALKKVGGFLLDHSDTIAKCLPYVAGLLAAYKAFSFVSSVVPGMLSFASSIASLASGGIKGLAAKLFGVASGQKAAGNAAATSAKQILAAGAAFLMIGAAALLIAASFALLAQSAIALSEAGGLAIGVMAGMGLALAGIGVGAAFLLKTLSALGPQVLNAGAALLMLGAAVLMVGAGFALMAQSAIALANSGGLAIGVMVGLVAVLALLAVGAAAIGAALTAGALGFIAFGAAMALVGVGALLAAAALSLIAGVLPTICSYGTQAAGAIAALGAGMLVFAVGAALAGAAAIVLGAGLLAAAVGIAACGVAVIVLGAGFMVLAAAAMVGAAALMMVASVLPTITANGTAAAAGIAALGAGLVAFAAGAAVAGAAATALGAGILVCAAGLTVAAAAALLLGAAVMMIGAGALMAAAGLATVASVLPLISDAGASSAAALALLGAALAAFAGPAAAAGAAAAALGAGFAAATAGAITLSTSFALISAGAMAASASLLMMQTSITALTFVLSTLGAIATAAMLQVTTAFLNAASTATIAGQQVGNGFANGLRSTSPKAVSAASQINSAVVAEFRSGYAAAFSAGAYIGQGLADGLLSMLGAVQAAAAKLASAATAAIALAAKVASPSKVTIKLGGFVGEGFAIGISDMKRDVWKAAEELVAIPEAATPKIAMAYSGEMSSDYDYYRNSEYVIEVPLTVDGKEFARATASYTQAELDKRQTRDSRKHGKV